MLLYEQKQAAVTNEKETPKFKPSGPVDPNLKPCTLCNRNFAQDRIEKHIQICRKSHEKAMKRKVKFKAGLYVPLPNENYYFRFILYYTVLVYTN